MKIVEIKMQDNGSHRNQSGKFETITNGWAVVPGYMELSNFPFGTVTANEIDGVMTVTNWEPGIIPIPEPTPAPAPTPEEQLRADIDYLSIMLGVDL